MAYVTEDLGYVTGIYQLEITDDVIGGVSGTSNQQAIELASRTKYLKDRFFDRTSHTMDAITQGTSRKWVSASASTLIEGLASGVLAGNVGINVSGPTERLEVDGNVKATGFIDTTLNNSLYQIQYDSDLTGIPENEKSKWSFSYSASTRVFTATITGSSYYYIRGKRFNVSGSLAWTAHSASSGFYFFYFDTSGVKQAGSTVWDILNTTQVAYVFYNSANDGGAADGLLFYELHGMSMSTLSHYYNHYVHGTQYVSGGSISGYTLNLASDVGIKWQTGSALIADEDNFISVPAQGTTTYNLFYFDAAGVLHWRTASLPVFVNSVTNNIQYNPVTGGLADVTNNGTYVNYYVAFTNANTSAKRIFVFPGQNVYTTLAAAQNNENIESINLVSIPFKEVVFMYKITFQYKTGSSITSGKSQIAATPVRIGVSSTNITSHTSLSGRAELNQHPASSVSTVFSSFDNLLSSADDTVQKALDSLDDRFLSCGVYAKPTFYDNGDGSANIGEGQYCLASVADGSASLKKYTIPAITLSFTDQVNNYVIADYNSGTPIVRSITDVNLINETTIIPIYTVYRNGATLFYLDWDLLARNLSNKLNQRLVKTQRFAREYGLGLSESTGRVINIGAGKVWYGAAYVLLDTFVSTSNTTVLHYHVGGVWTSTNVTQYNNTQYDNGTNLVSTTNNKYVVNWIYRRVSTTVQACIVLGTGDYTLVEAQTAQPPSNLPSAIASQAVLVGRIIVMAAATTATQVDSSFLINFTQGASTTDHNSLYNLLGGASGLYYHLKESDYNLFTSAKGDLLVGGASTSLTKLTVGTNNYVLTADSTQTSGIKWAALPSATTSVAGVVTLASDGGTTASTVVQATDGRLTNARTPTSHTHGNITNAGAIGSTTNLPVITTTSGVLTVGSFGSTANTFCEGNDTRLTTTDTWLPVLQFGGTSTGIVYSTQSGTWVKTAYGYLITVRLIITNKGSSTGAATITLPFTSSSTNASSCVVIPITGMSSLTAGGCILGFIGSSSGVINLYTQASSAVANLTDANFTSSSNIALSIYYKV